MIDEATVIPRRNPRNAEARKWLPRLCFFATLSSCVWFALPPLLHAQPEPIKEATLTKEIYQDFRNKRPLLASFQLGGPDLASETKAENEGLRVTIPAVREHHWPVGVVSRFSLSGDFEATGTYELLSVERPIKGYGNGVNLSISDNEARTKFSKIGRVMDVAKGSVHLTEHWYKGPPKTPWSQQHKKTEAKAGQLRLVRSGRSLRYLVSDGPGQEFREIWYQKNFGDEDLKFLKFSVTDSGEPGNPVDARLIDLRVRLGPMPADSALTPAPLAEPAPVTVPPLIPGGQDDKDRPGRSLLIILLLGLGLTLVVGISLATWYVLSRRRNSSPVPEEKLVEEVEAEMPPIVITCSYCGKKLKVESASAGKRVKCSQCGKGVPVPKS